MEAKSTKVIYVTNIPERKHTGKYGEKSVLLNKQVEKLPINKCLVEQYDDSKSASIRANIVRTHFNYHKIKGFKVNVCVRQINKISNVYIWKTKEPTKTE